MHYSFLIFSKYKEEQLISISPKCYSHWKKYTCDPVEKNGRACIGREGKEPGFSGCLLWSREY